MMVSKVSQCLSQVTFLSNSVGQNHSSLVTGDGFSKSRVSHQFKIDSEYTIHHYTLGWPPFSNSGK